MRDTTAEYKYNTSANFGSIPDGIMITDTFNSEVGVVVEALRIDTYVPNIKLLKENYYRDFRVKPGSYLPYHYVVERIENDFVVYSTRPLSYRSGLSQKKNYVVIAIMGDSKLDIYSGAIYKVLGDLINGLRHAKPFSGNMRKNVIWDPEIKGSNFSYDMIMGLMKG